VNAIAGWTPLRLIADSSWPNIGSSVVPACCAADWRAASSVLGGKRTSGGVKVRWQIDCAWAISSLFNAVAGLFVVPPTLDFNSDRRPKIRIAQTARSPRSENDLTKRSVIRRLDSSAMSGHSKWSSIKHKKGAKDARRGQLFTKLARAIQVAAREGGPDPAGNATLAVAIEKARAASMPKDNIERAIAKGSGAGADADRFEAVTYEGYGPGGVALLVEALTDNRNRTGSDIRHIFSKSGGNLGEPGSVAWIFEKKGEIVVDAQRYSEDDLFAAIDAGAEDVNLDESVFEVVTDPADFAAVRAALTEAGVEFDSADVTMRPTTQVPVEDSQVSQLMRLIEALEDNDDVQAVHANFDVDAEVLERAMA
jgi:YebC/PmpR family DNA-binding regulatory protein